MPAFLQYGSCTIDGDLADATLAARETFTDLGTALAATGAYVEDLATDLDATLGNELRGELRNFLVNPSLTDIQTLLCTPPVTSVQQAEDSLRDRDGTSVVGGRVLVPGDLNLVCLRTLQRLLGSYEAAMAQVSSLAEGTFLWIVTALQRTSSGVTVCNPTETITETEVVLGINQSFVDVGRARGIDVTTLKAYVFWSQYANPSGTNFRRLEVLGCPPNEIGLVLIEQSGIVVQTCVLQEPSRYGALTTVYGPTAGDVVADGPDTLDPFVLPATILGLLRSKGLSRVPGSRNPCGTIDFADPAANILSAVDFPASLQVDKAKTDCLPEVSDTPGYASILAVVDVITTVAQTSLTVIRTAQWIFNSPFSLITLYQSIVGDAPNANLLGCLAQNFPSSAVSFNIPGMRNLVGILRAREAQYDEVVRAFQGWYGQYTDALCVATSLLGSVVGRTSLPVSAPSLPIAQLRCLPVEMGTNIPLPECLQDALQKALDMIDVIQNLSARVQQNFQSSRQIYRELTDFLEHSLAADSGILDSIEETVLGLPTTIPAALSGTVRASLPTSPVCNPVTNAEFLSTVRAAIVAATGESGVADTLLGSGGT